MSCLLRYIGLFEDAKEAMQWVLPHRLQEPLELALPLLGPTFRRSLRYFDEIMAMQGIVPNSHPLILHQLLVNTIPDFDGKGGCEPGLEVFLNGELLFTTQSAVEHEEESEDDRRGGVFGKMKQIVEQRETSPPCVFVDKEFIMFKMETPVKLLGDVQLRLFHHNSITGQNQTICSISVNTGFLADGVIRMQLGDVEKPCSNAFENTKRISSSFSVDLVLTQGEGEGEELNYASYCVFSLARCLLKLSHAHPLTPDSHCVKALELQGHRRFLAKLSLQLTNNQIHEAHQWLSFLSNKKELMQGIERELASIGKKRWEKVKKHLRNEQESPSQSGDSAAASLQTPTTTCGEEEDAPILRLSHIRDMINRQQSIVEVEVHPLDLLSNEESEKETLIEQNVIEGEDQTLLDKETIDLDSLNRSLLEDQSSLKKVSEAKSNGSPLEKDLEKLKIQEETSQARPLTGILNAGLAGVKLKKIGSKAETSLSESASPSKKSVDLGANPQSFKEGKPQITVAREGVPPAPNFSGPAPMFSGAIPPPPPPPMFKGPPPTFQGGIPPPPPPMFGKTPLSMSSSQPASGATSGSLSPPFDPHRPVVKRDLHWRELRHQHQVRNTVWGEIVEGTKSDTIIPPSNITLFEDLFCVSPSGLSDRNASSSSLLPRGRSKEDTPALLPLQRANIVGIGLSRFFKRLPTDDAIIETITRHHAEILSLDDLDTLKTILPSEEETRLLNDHVNKGGALCGRAEKFLHAASLKPKLSWMIEVMSLEKRLDAELEDLVTKATTLQRVLERLASSERIKLLLKAVLELGNLTNYEYGRKTATTQRKTATKALGFRLDSLLKLNEVQSVDKKTNLLDYLVGVLAETQPQVLELPAEFAELGEVRHWEMAALRSGLADLQKSLKSVQEMLPKEEEAQDPLLRSFIDAITPFLDLSRECLEGATRIIQSQLTETWNRTASYFGEDPESSQPEELLTIFELFFRQLKISSDARKLQKLKQSQTPKQVSPVSSTKSSAASLDERIK